MSLHILRRTVVGTKVGSGPKHCNGAYEVTWVARGQVQFDIGSTVLDASAGTCVILPPEVENIPRLRTADLHQFWLPASWLKEAVEALGPAARVPGDARILGADTRLTSLIRLLVEEAAEGLPTTDPALRALTDALVYGLVRNRSREEARQRLDPRIRRALELIADSYAEPLSVDALAAAAGLCRFSFLRLFRASMGESPYQYLTMFRLDQAAGMLRRSADTSVLETALACGFGDPGRFARAFRARYGCSPREYRARSIVSR